MKGLMQLLGSAISGWQWIGASVGAVVGFAVLLLTFQFNHDLEATMQEQRSLFEPEYLVVNKKVGLLKSLGLAGSGFTPEELDELANQRFVQSIAPFTANHFKVQAYTEASSTFPPFYTELFFESVPSNYLDLEEIDWDWLESWGEVPIIVPRDYLSLYNFGFAQSQDLPQITPGMIQLITFNLRMEGPRGTKVMKGRIVGFSERLNTILVPQTFMDWANNTLGDPTPVSPTRVVLVTEDPADPALADFLEQKQYETKRDQLKNSQLNQLLKQVLLVLGAVGLVLLLLAFFLFVVSFQLLIQRSAHQLKGLIRLGYHYRHLAGGYIALFLVLIVVVFGVALSVLTAVRGELLEWAFQAGLAIEGGMDPTTLALGIVVAATLWLVNAGSIWIQLWRLARNN